MVDCDFLPRTAGVYVVERLLGAGAMGTVVAARHPDTGQRVAIKLLKDDLLDREGARHRFLREARVMAELNHPNIVRALDFGALDDGSPFLVMELLDGDTLRSELRARGPLPIEEAVDYVIESCLGLAAAHARGIVHRDIKPSNLFLARTGSERVVKVLDFGVSKLPKATDHELSLTDTSMILGSPSYMSPEQVRLSKRVDARADVWGLGVTLYQLLTGRLPFVGEGFSAICAAVTVDRPAPMRPDRPSIPAELEAVVFRCLEKGPDWRYPNVEALGAALASFGSERGRALAAAFGPPPPHPKADESSTSIQTVTVSVARAQEPRTVARSTSAFRAGVILASAVLVALGVGVGLTRARAPAATAASTTPPAAAVSLSGAAAAPSSQSADVPTQSAAQPEPPAGETSSTSTAPRETAAAGGARSTRLHAPRAAKPAAAPRPSAKPAAFGGSALDDHN